MSSELFNLATATTTTSSSSKSFVYREVDNVHLDRLCHQQVIRHAQYVTSNSKYFRCVCSIWKIALDQ